MASKIQHGFGCYRRALVDEDELRKVDRTTTPCKFSEVLKRAKRALAQGDGTHTRIANWLSENPDFDCKT